MSKKGQKHDIKKKLHKPVISFKKCHWQFFDIQMPIFRRVRSRPTFHKYWQFAICVSTGLCCGDDFEGPNGVVKSPLFPDPYPNNLECDMVIVVAESKHVRLNITHFSTELNADTLTVSCYYIKYRLSLFCPTL